MKYQQHHMVAYSVRMKLCMLLDMRQCHIRRARRRRRHCRRRYNPLLRERLGAPCDTGRTRTELLRCFPQIASWEGVLEMREVWWSTSTEYDLLERVEALKQWLLARPEQTIAIVGHGGLFQRILGYHLKNCGFAWTELSDA